MSQPIEKCIPSEIPIGAPSCQEPDPVEHRRTFLRARPDLHVRHPIDDVLVQPMPEGAVMDPGWPAPPSDAAHIIHAVTRDEVERRLKAISRDWKG